MVCATFPVAFGAHVGCCMEPCLWSVLLSVLDIGLFVCANTSLPCLCCLGVPPFPVGIQCYLMLGVFYPTLWLSCLVVLQTEYLFFFDFSLLKYFRLTLFLPYFSFSLVQSIWLLAYVDHGCRVQYDDMALNCLLAVLSFLQ